MPNYEKLARGVEVAVEGKFVIVKVDTDKAKGEPSSSGKMELTASTGGFKDIEGTKGFRISLMGGYRT